MVALLVNGSMDQAASQKVSVIKLIRNGAGQSYLTGGNVQYSHSCRIAKYFINWRRDCCHVRRGRRITTKLGYRTLRTITAMSLGEMASPWQSPQKLHQCRAQNPELCQWLHQSESEGDQCRRSLRVPRSAETTPTHLACTRLHLVVCQTADDAQFSTPSTELQRLVVNQ